MQRGEHERQHRLGDARTCRQSGREFLQALVRPQALDEGVEDGTVHDVWPNEAFGRVVMVRVRYSEHAARAVEAARVPAVHRVDGDARAGMRRVDELVVADVQADVPEAVEEDEVAGLEAGAGHVAAEAELRDRVVRQRDRRSARRRSG